MEVFGSPTNAFLNLSGSAGLETRRLLLLTPEHTTKHVVAEVDSLILGVREKIIPRLLIHSWCLGIPAILICYSTLIGTLTVVEHPRNPDSQPAFPALSLHSTAILIVTV